MCKPWKINGNNNGWEPQDTHSVQLQKEDMDDQLEELELINILAPNKEGENENT